MMKRRICWLALPLLSIAACLDVSAQDSADGTSSRAPVATPDPGGLAGSQADAIAVAQGPRICESYGSLLCVGAPTIAFEDPVLETAGGRVFFIRPVDGGVNLAFNADPTRCVAVRNATALVEVRACANVESATWIPQVGPDGHSCLFLNKRGGYLSGPNNVGQFEVVARGQKGWSQQFTAFSVVPTHLPCGA
jgi:hypothetical protein